MGQIKRHNFSKHSKLTVAKLVKPAVTIHPNHLTVTAGRKRDKCKDCGYINMDRTACRRCGGDL